MQRHKLSGLAGWRNHFPCQKSQASVQERQKRNTRPCSDSITNPN
ncbi:unnamed protein product [Spirodela intermedia]|uniref:Uncharacterized protein n=2 Tax=Spirodela intermedia TaxID=51605 RepID=A0A7I8KWE4_SPIIN|nr:unnamed protein product [Spirodela intermedia]CAA6665211.1 unnamed protein product [Spirodela intermedia]CAA7401941.1 unnamed protein product [Spirodela intermedia]